MTWVVVGSPVCLLLHPEMSSCLVGDIAGNAPGECFEQYIYFMYKIQSFRFQITTFMFFLPSVGFLTLWVCIVRVLVGGITQSCRKYCTDLWEVLQTIRNTWHWHVSGCTRVRTMIATLQNSCIYLCMYVCVCMHTCMHVYVYAWAYEQDRQLTRKGDQLEIIMLTRSDRSAKTEMAKQFNGC